MKTLQEIAAVKFGPQLKSKRVGEVKYLHANHFDEQYLPTRFEHSYVSDLSLKEEHLLTEKQVILAAKGLRFFAWNYQASMGPATSSSLFYHIDCDTQVLRPAFLAAFLNKNSTQVQLMRSSMGSSVPSLRKRELLETEIPLPNLEEQDKLIAMIALQQKDLALTKKLLLEKKKLMEGYLDSALQTLYNSTEKTKP